MPTKTSRPSAQRSSTSHHHRSKPSATTPTGRIATSAGSSMPPSLGHVRTPALNVDPSRLAALRSPGIQQETSAPRTPSPNYFGLSVEPSDDSRSAIGPKSNWSPPTSSIRSFNPQSPQHIPVDSNPAFEAFKRATQQNNGFHLSHGNLQHFATTPGPGTSRFERQPARQEEDGFFASRPRDGDAFANVMDTSGHEPSYFPTESKPARPSASTPSFFDIPRQESPASMLSGKPPPAGSFKPKMPPRTASRSGLSRLDDKHPRLSLPHNKVDPPSPPTKAAAGKELKRGDTLPPTLEDGPTFIAPETLKDLLQTLKADTFLLLDLRVAPQYSQYRIRDALNLCIPTTLLKRPSFNIEKLTDTFKIEEEKARFSLWKSCKYIIVYDARSTEKKDALSAMNTLKKFSNEGWTGQSYVLKGGVEAFAAACPQHIDRRSSHEMHATADEALPVAGGCLMPESKNNGANPFFSNIRQNMDLVGGVGQMDVKLPEDPEHSMNKALPTWLLKAADPDNHGKAVSDKFLHIEEAELARMQKALSSRVSYGTPQADTDRNVQIAGFEKGSKNRYNNIWPFEHSRVRLHGKEDAACDYVNASHVKAPWSNKRYIASQGPLPATYEDFWSVIWHQDVRVIVMLTAESEGGQLKCHPYWSGKHFGPFHLKSLSEKKVSLEPNKHRRSSTRQISGPVAALASASADSGRRRAATTTDSPLMPKKEDESKETPYVVVRKFTLAHSSEPFKPMREITQLHYSSWPDFGAPAQPAHLLALVELSNATQRGTLPPHAAHKPDDPESYDESRPMLVHCSAGCGRTGTFCTVDSVVDMLKRQRKEASSGITPMEGTERADGNYMSKGRHDDEGWVFNPEIDLIEKTVSEFRKQRISMVQSLIQYVLCYETVLEWIQQQRIKAQ